MPLHESRKGEHNQDSIREEESEKQVESKLRLQSTQFTKVEKQEDVSKSKVWIYGMLMLVSVMIGLIIGFFIRKR